MKTDYSLECAKCGLYNLQDGIIDKGNIYCNECSEKIHEQRRKWRRYKEFKVVKVPIIFRKGDGKKVTFNATKLVRRKPVKRWRI